MFPLKLVGPSIGLASKSCAFHTSPLFQEYFPERPVEATTIYVALVVPVISLRERKHGDKACVVLARAPRLPRQRRGAL